MRKQIYNLHSEKAVRFCDVIVEADEVHLEIKSDKGTYQRIPWDDVVYQVKVAEKIAKNY